LSEFKEYTDEDLMLFLQEGKSEALTELFHRYSDKLYHFFFKMLNNDGPVAEDFVQDLFIKVLKSKHTYCTDHAFSSWIYSIGHNMVKNEYRKRSSQKRNAISVELHSVESKADKINLEQVADQMRFQSELSEILIELTDEKRDLFLMRHYLGLSVKELSEVFEIPEGTVKSRIHHITNWVSKRLTHYNNEL
jgi:RNA polymerase sigma-70 factor (ECF subfamily)